MKLHGSTKSKLTKDKNGENMPYLEITEAVLIHCIPCVDTIIRYFTRKFYIFKNI